MKSFESNFKHSELTYLPQYHIAQLNIAHLIESIDSPRLSDFVENLERINRLAEESPGFVWRLQTEEGDATSVDFFGSDYVVNLSVWDSIDTLHRYVYRSAHVEMLRRKKEWFHKMKNAYQVLWWLPAGSTPTIDEAAKRLALVRRLGPTKDAFTFKNAFPSPGEQQSEPVASWDEGCPAT